MAPDEKYYYGTGRRKQASARVRLFASKGNVVVNGKRLDEYFSVPMDRILATEPLRLCDVGQLRASIKVSGGGNSGQAGAIRLGLARALNEFNPEFRPLLKSAGMLTRDARVKERKKPGLKRARKAPQFTKR